MIFQSALAAVGPKILSMEGELKNIVFVEFPDDIGAPELVTIKEGYRLVRKKPDGKGEYAMKIFARDSERCVSHIRFDKKDRIISAQLFGKVTLEEIKDEK
jgi:hypothetical protein